MVSANTLLVAKLKNHSKVGLRVKIHKPRVKLKSFKRDKLNIQILNFHSTILDKYKILGNFFLEQNFRFLQFIAPVGRGDVFIKKAVNTKVITKEKIKRIVETIYKDKEKLIEDFRLKELIVQRAELLYNEQKLNDTKEIKEVLTKELDSFSKKLDSTELDDRIILYTKLNNYLNTININHQNIEYKIDKNLYLNYSSKEVKNIIQKFEMIDSVEYKRVDEYLQNIENIIRPIGVTLNNNEIVVDKKTINKILNIKNITTVNEIAPIFTKSFENTILKTSENIWQVLNKDSINIQMEEVVNLSENITINLEKQLKTLFKNVSFTSEYKSILINELKTIFLNSEYTKETKVNEINNSINTYVSNTVIQNQNKQSFTIENKKVIEEKLYEQSIQKINTLGINLHFVLKNDLRNIIKNRVSKTTSINTIQVFERILNEVIQQFLIKQQNSIVNNTSVLKKYTNHNTTILSDRNIETQSEYIKLGKNISILNNIEQKVEEVYENIVNEIKLSSEIKRINKEEKNLITQKIEQILSSGDIKQSSIYTQIVTEFINKIEVKTSSTKELYKTVEKNIENKELIIQKLYEEAINILGESIDKNELLVKITNLSKLTTVNEINKSYQEILNTYLKVDNKTILENKIQNIVEKNIIAKQIDVESLYKNIVNEINNTTTNKHLNIINKNHLLKKITKLTNLSSIKQLNKEYQNIINEYKIDTLSIRSIESEMFSLTKLGDTISITSTMEERIEALYENIIKEIKTKEPLKQINTKEKSKILQKIQELIKVDSIEQINRGYKNILKQFTKNIEQKDVIVQDIQLETIHKNILNEIKQLQPSKQITTAQKSQIFKRVQNIIKLDSIEQINKEYKAIVEEYSQNLSIQNITKELNVDSIYQNIINEINKTNTKKHISIVNKNELLKKITKLSKLSNVTQINKEYQNIINEYKIGTTSIKDIDTSVSSFTKLGDNISISNIMEQRVESLYENIINEIRVNEPKKDLSSTQKTKILKKLKDVIKLDNIEMINKEYKTILKEFTTKELKDITLELNTKNIYENIVNEINQNSTSKHINIVNKNELLKKVSNLTKLSSITQINKEYQNIINEYKIDDINTYRSDIINMTKLGDNISITKNYEQKMQNIYQNIVKEIKKTKPLKQINNIEKSQILQKIDKIVKLNNQEQINKEYKTVVEQFVNKTKIQESPRESIIKKLISNTKEIQDTNLDKEIEKNTNTLIKNIYKTKEEEKSFDEGLVYVSATEHKKKKEKKLESEIKDVDYKINEKEYQFTMNIENIYKNFDENLDEMALKIFRDIKDELSMQYKRI